MSMTMSEAYEFLGEQIGESLALNGVHGAQLTKIAEKLKKAQADAQDGIRALEALGGAKALDLTPDSVLVIKDSDAELDYRRMSHLKTHLGVKSILVLPDDGELDLVGEEWLLHLCLNLVKSYPGFYQSIVKQVLGT